MLPCVVFDLPTFGVLTFAVGLIVTIYLIYRDIRMMMQMVMDLREEFMVLSMVKPQNQEADAEGGDGHYEDEEEEDDDMEEEEEEGEEEEEEEAGDDEATQMLLPPGQRLA